MTVLGAHSQTFIGGGAIFQKPTRLNFSLFISTINENACIIVKQGFAVVVAFCYICLFKNPAITILKVGGGSDCGEKTSYHYGGLGNSCN